MREGLTRRPRPSGVRVRRRRHQGRQGQRAGVRPHLQGHLPEPVRPGGPDRARLPRHPAERGALHARHRPPGQASRPGPSAASSYSPLTRHRHQARGREVSRASTGHEHGHERLAGAGVPGRGRRRAGVVPVPVRAAAGARLPLVRHRHERRRPGRAAAGPAAAGRRRCSSLGFTVVFVSAGLAFGGFGALLQRHATSLTRVLGAVTIVLGPGVHGVRARPAAHGQVEPAAGRGCGGRAAARHAVRPRLDPVHRPDARGRPGDGLHRGERHPRRAAVVRVLPRARACRSCSPPWPTAGRSARSASSSGTTRP